ncbi:MAG TPA: hypothetical protein PKA31_02575 [Candidatus Moranbacteria bacterium]|nr:hypothetical protein [Candidatus Moranbacteria bacterium]
MQMERFSPSKGRHEGFGPSKDKAQENRAKLLKGAYGDLDEEERKWVMRANLEKFKKGALADMSPAEIEARRLETQELLRDGKAKGGTTEVGEADLEEEENKPESSGEFLRRIREEMGNMRPQVARYWETRSFLEKKEMGEALRIQNAKIKEEIRKAQEEYMKQGDIMIASDLDNCAVELEKIMRAIPTAEEDSYKAAA